jgi:hypothetical protein
MTIEMTITALKPYSIKELADIYGVCDKTFKKWLKPFETIVGAKQGRYFTVAQVRIIFEKLGVPGIVS